MKRSSGLRESLQLYAESPAMKRLAPVFVAVVSDTSVAVKTAQTLQLYANSPVIKGLAPAFVVALVSDTGPASKTCLLTRTAAMNIGPGLRDWMLVVAVATALTLQLYADSSAMKVLVPPFVVAVVSDTGLGLRRGILPGTAALDTGRGLEDCMLVVARATLQLYADSPVLKRLAPAFVVAALSDKPVAVAKTLQLYADSPAMKGLVPAFVVAVVSVAVATAQNL